MRDEGLQTAIDAAGGVGSLAQCLGIRQPSVSSWVRVPADRVLAVEAKTGVRRERLRPDLYPDAGSKGDARSGSSVALDEVERARATEYLLLARLLRAAPSAAFLAEIAQLGGNHSPLGMAHIELAEAASRADASEVAAEYFSLMLVGLVFAVVLARGNILKAVIMIVLGLLLSTVGTDVNTGQERLTFGIGALVDRIDFAVLAMGLFGIAELLRSLENPEARDVVKAHIGSVLPTQTELMTSLKPIFRGIGLGTVLGALPGNGAVLAPFGSYALEKKLAKDPSRFGKGAIEGVAGPEAANNAGAQAAFIPLLTLGIPPNAVMALMVGAMTIHGIVPGPQVMTRNPDLFWGMIASMWIGNLALLIINLPLVGLWVKLLQVPYRLMFPAILAFCCIGVYSINNQPADILITAFFGLAGYGLLKLGFELAPLLLSFVLGGFIEDTFRRAMDLSHGSMMTFVERPVSLGLLAVGLVVLVIAALPAVAKKREKAFVE